MGLRSLNEPSGTRFNGFLPVSRRIDPAVDEWDCGRRTSDPEPVSTGFYQIAAGLIRRCAGALGQHHVIPPLDDNGFLPPGIHACTLDEIGQRFARFGRTGQRPRLFERLRAYVAEARQMTTAVAVIVNGSFATAKPEPGDVDIILVVRPDHDFNAVVLPFEYNLVSRKRVTGRYQFDLLVTAVDGAREYREWTEFLERVEDRPDLRKGILRVNL